MARITAVPASSAGWLVRLVYWAARRRYGQVPEPAAVQAHHRGLLLNNVLFELGNQRVLRKADPALRDLAVHRVSTVVGCSWCVDFSTMLAVRQGMSAERLGELHRYRESGAFNQLEKQVIEYADAVTAQPMTVTDDQVAALRGQLGEERLVELTYAIALENQRARFNHALGVTDQGFTSGQACRVQPPAQEPESASRG
jgi:AhpD family alkylhydroperoxidase